MKTILENLTELQRIAKKNDDEFKYSADIDLRRDGLWITFTAAETADRHAFVSGYGRTLEEAVNNACEDIKDACESWDYKQ